MWQRTILDSGCNAAHILQTDNELIRDSVRVSGTLDALLGTADIDCKGKLGKLGQAYTIPGINDELLSFMTVLLECVGNLLRR